MSIKIKTLEVARLRNDAHFQFHKDVSALISSEGPDKLNIRALSDVYQPTIDKEDEVLKKIVKSEFTEKIHDADKERDRVYSCVTAIVRALVKHYNDDVVDAAKRLKIVIDTYGDVNRKSYNEQTSAVYNILQEFNGKYADDVALVKITEMVNELERTNNVVDALIKERLDEAAHKNHDTMKHARAETDAAYHAITERVNAAVIIEGEAAYASFIERMNTLIDSYKVLLAHKAKHKKHGGAEEDGTL